MKAKPKSKIQEYLAFGFILILTELVVFKHLFFSIEYDCAIGRDWPIHAINASKIYHCHFNFEKILVWYESTASSIYHYPPFHYLLSAALWEFLKLPPLLAMYASKAIWIFLGALAMYGAGRALGDNVYSGIVASVVGILNGLMLNAAREVSLEFVVPMSFAFIACFYMLSKGYQRFLPSLALGAALGIGLLSKSVLFTFAAPFLVLGFFISPFRVKNFSRRLSYAAFAAFSAFLIAAPFYLTSLKPFLREAGSESNISFMHKNLIHFYPYYIAPDTTPFMLVLIALSAIILIIKRDSFFMLTFLIMLITIPYMATLQSLDSTYFLSFTILFALVIARGLKYLKSAFRFALCLVIAFVFCVPILTNKSPFRNNRFVRFLYPEDKWVNIETLQMSDRKSENSWENIERFALTFKNRYPEYGYEQVGYVLADGMVNVVNIAFALEWEKNAWLRDIKWWEDIVKINLHPMPYDEDPLKKIRGRELIVFSLPDQTPNERYKRLHEIFDELKAERTIDFRFPMYWDYKLPGNYKILFLAKR